jgi:hypothetical protein
VTGLILITNSAACMPQIYHHWSKIVTGLILITNSVTCMPQILPLDWLHMYTYIWKQLFPPGGQPRFCFLPNCQKTSSAFLTRAEVPIYTPLYTPFGNGEGRGCSVCPSFNVCPSHHWNFAARMLQIYHHRSKIVTGLILITNSATCMPQIYHHWSKIVTGLIIYPIWERRRSGLLGLSIVRCPSIAPLEFGGTNAAELPSSFQNSDWINFNN